MFFEAYWSLEPSLHTGWVPHQLKLPLTQRLTGLTAHVPEETIDSIFQADQKLLSFAQADEKLSGEGLLLEAIERLKPAHALEALCCVDKS